jgi:hypothetical protein
MGLTADTRAMLALCGGWIRRYRGDCPDAFLAALMASEVGVHWTPAGCYALSSDHHLGEMGGSQEPVFVALAAGVDPCSWQGGVWLRCRVSHQDARWLRGLRAQCPKCGEVMTTPLAQSEWTCTHCGHTFASGWPRLFPVLGRDLWFCVLLRYSVGKGALHHVLDAVEMRIAGKVRDGRPVGTVTAEIGEWARRTDLSLPPHIRYWGRQLPAKILERLQGKKHLRRIDAAAVVGCIEGPQYVVGPEPPERRPPGAPPFPSALVHAAQVLGNSDSADAACEAAWHQLDVYVRQERRATGDVRTLARKFAESVGIVKIGRTDPRPSDA